MLSICAPKSTSPLPVSLPVKPSSLPLPQGLLVSKHRCGHALRTTNPEAILRWPSEGNERGGRGKAERQHDSLGRQGRRGTPFPGHRPADLTSCREEVGRTRHYLIKGRLHLLHRHVYTGTRVIQTHSTRPDASQDRATQRYSPEHMGPSDSDARDGHVGRVLLSSFINRGSRPWGHTNPAWGHQVQGHSGTRIQVGSSCCRTVSGKATVPSC